MDNEGQEKTGSVRQRKIKTLIYPATGLTGFIMLEMQNC
jgi:hypothetical protein